MQWFFNASPGARPEARLFCFPYAGGSAAAFRDWGRQVGPLVELLGVQLPGRGWRMKEPPGTDLLELADGAAAAMMPLTDRPFAVFGHSMGAWLALEVARRLQAAGHAPAVLIVSGRQAPALGGLHPALGHLDDEAFVREMQARYNAIPQQILASPEVLELVLPALRADIVALERYASDPGEPLSCPILGLLGDSDPVVSPADMAPWEAETRAGFSLELLPGGHFYFADDVRPVTSFLRRALEGALTGSASGSSARGDGGP